MHYYKNEIEITYEGKPAKVKFKVLAEDMIKAQAFGYSLDALSRVSLYLYGTTMVTDEEDTKVDDCMLVVDKSSFILTILLSFILYYK